MKGYINAILGNLYLIKYQREKAIKCFKIAIANNTKNILAIYNYGLILLQDGNFEDALKFFFHADSLNKKKLKKQSFLPEHLNRTILLDKHIPLAISSCYWRLDKLDDAINTLESLRKKYSYIGPNALTTLGYFYLLAKNYDKAIEISQMAIDDTESFSSAWDNLGQIYFEQENKALAKEKFLKAIEYNPKSVDSLYHLGLIEESENNTDNAIMYFEKALKCNITSLNTVSKEDIENKIKILIN